MERQWSPESGQLCYMRVEVERNSKGYNHTISVNAMAEDPLVVEALVSELIVDAERIAVDSVSRQIHHFEAMS